jgi:alpha-beta hydrolase superfamily lysophospholipase
VALSEPLATYLELRQSGDDGEALAGLSHKAGGLFLLHVLELAAHGEPRGGVTVVHDVGEHGGRYLELARVLAEAHCAVALPDMRGHGKSEGRRGHSAGFKEVLRDLEAVQDHLAYRLPVAPKVLLGVGTGAVQAAAYALERPGTLAGLVLVAPRLTPRFQPPASPSGLMKLFKKLPASAPGRLGFDVEQLFADSDARLAFAKDAQVHDVISLSACEAAHALAERVRGAAREMAVPLLVLYGAEDRACDVGSLRAVFPAGAKFQAVPAARERVLHDAGSVEAHAAIREFVVGVM